MFRAAFAGGCTLSAAATEVASGPDFEDHTIEFSLPTAILGSLIGSLILFGAMLYVRFLPGAPRGLGLWAAAMGLNALRLLTYLGVPLLGGPLATFFAESLQAVVAILLLAGTLAFAGRTQRRLTLVVLGLVACGWSAVTSFGDFSFILRTVPLYLLGGGAMILTGVILVRHGKVSASTEERFTGMAFIAWGVHKLNFPFLRPVEWFAPWGFTLAQTLSMVVAIGLILAALRRLHDRVQVAGKEIEQSHQEQSALNSLLRVSLETLPLKAQLEQSLDIIFAVPWLGVLPKGGVFVTDTATGRLVLTANRDMPNALLECCAKVDFGECLCGRAALTREIQHASCVDERHEIRYDGMTPHGHYSVPIVSNDRTLGVMVLYLEAGREAKTRELAFLESVASIIAGVIERAESASALHTSEARLSEALRIAGLANWELNLLNGELYWSDDVYRIFGMEPQSAAATTELFYRLVHPDDRERVRAVTRAAIENQEPYVLEFRIVLPHGEERVLHEEAVIESNDTGTPAHLHGTVQDVTKRDAAQRALRENEQLLRAVLDNSPAIIAIRDIEGRFQLVNSAYEKMFGVTNEAITGKIPADFMPADFADALKSYDREVIETGKTLLHEHKAALELGGDTLLSARFPIRDAAGAVVGIGSIATDITEHKHLEEQLRQSQKMEAVGQLTGGIAHDFNNLLAVIYGNLELAAESVDQTSRTYELVSNSMEAATKGAELTSRLLAYSRKQPLQPATLDINAQIDAMIELLRRTLGETIEIETRFADDLWSAKVDQSQIENAILNLAVNARDAMPKGGRLSITTANAPLQAAEAAAELELEPGDYVKVVVSDSGKGMEAAVLEHAFEPFYTTKGVGMGTGLGLSMVYGFAKQSGGHVTIESIVGKGTAITLYLPRAVQAAVETRHETADALPRGQGEVVLVVEDDPDVRNLAEVMLGDLGYETLSAPDAGNALTLLKATDTVDLVLTDVVLTGGVSGPELVREVSAVRPCVDVLYMSGYAEGAAVPDGPFDGDTALLQKPFRKRDLAKKVHQVLSRP